MALASPYSRTEEEASASKKVGLVISDEDWAEFQAFRERKEEYARIELNKKKYIAYEEHEKDIAMFLQNKNAFFNYMNQISSDNTESQHLTPGTEASSQGTQNLAGGDGIAAPMEQDNQDGTWQQYTRRRRRNRSDKSTSQTPTHTVVLKPVCREDVYNIASKNIRDAITKTGVSDKECSVHTNDRSNTIAITTKNREAIDKLMTIGKIDLKGKALEMKPYVAASSSQIKGVIYLRGYDNDETPDSLTKELECKTHQISSARIIGQSGRTVLITLEGRSLPNYVRYACEAFRVTSYRPRPLVCYNCHLLGHKADVCPINIKRCSSCGHEHDASENCKLQPKCVNCGGTHVATSNDCPKRTIPPKKVKPPPPHKKLQSNSSYASGQATTNSSQQTPSPEFLQSFKNFPTLPSAMQPLSSNAWNYPLHQSGGSNTSSAASSPLGWIAEVQATHGRIDTLEGKVGSLESKVDKLCDLVYALISKQHGK